MRAPTDDTESVGNAALFGHRRHGRTPLLVFDHCRALGRVMRLEPVSPRERLERAVGPELSRRLLRSLAGPSLR